MNIEFAGGVQVDPFEEGQHVSAGVAAAGLVQDLSGGDVECGEQVGGAVPAVVTGRWRFGASFGCLVGSGGVMLALPGRVGAAGGARVPDAAFGVVGYGERGLARDRALAAAGHRGVAPRVAAPPLGRALAA